MKGILGVAIGGIFLLGAGGAFATPPGPGQCFNGASNPGPGFSGCDTGICATDTPECAKDDSGCVPDTKNHEKCSAAVVKAFDKAIQCVIKCHCKQAQNLLANKQFNEEACESGPSPKANSCKEKLDATRAKLTAAGICSGTQNAGAAVEEATLFADKSNSLSLDAQNGATFCDSTSGSMIMASDSDDAGFVPANKDVLKCECTVGKNLGKLVHASLICHVKLAHSFALGKAFDEEACEEIGGGKGALGKFNHARDVIIAKGVCPPCQDAAHQDTLAAGALGQVDAANVIAYPCP